MLSSRGFRPLQGCRGRLRNLLPCRIWSCCHTSNTNTVYKIGSSFLLLAVINQLSFFFFSCHCSYSFYCITCHAFFAFIKLKVDHLCTWAKTQAAHSVVCIRNSVMQLVVEVKCKLFFFSFLPFLVSLLVPSSYVPTVVLRDHLVV